MRALVTGGSGFIGSHVVDSLLACGVEPRIFDMRPSDHHSADAVELHLGDIGDLGDLRAAMVGCDVVIHLAAVADVNHVVIDPPFSEAVNSQGTMNVLEAAREARLERIIYGSTIWVYNGLGDVAVDEDTPLVMPDHFYTATKLASEMYVKSFCELCDIPWTILRFGIPYGPRARPAAVVPAFVNRALAGQPLTVAGGGQQSRRFVYVEDLADGVVRSLDSVAANRIFNLVGDETVTILGVAEVVRDLIGSVDIVHTEGRPADFKGAEVSGDRAACELGWRSSTPFVEGVRRYLDWHREATSAVDEQPAVG